jgi:hypothetical protein
MTSKFDKMLADDGEVVEAEQEWVPRVIFTTNSTPDLTTMQIPTLRLAQGMTAEVVDRKANIGQYVLTNYPAIDEVILVPFAAQHVRFYKPDPKARPECQAPTGTFGIGNPGGECARCPLSKWGPRDPATGKSSRPPCMEGIAVRGYSITHRSLVDFQFNGSSIPKGQFIAQQAMAFGYAGFAVRMRSEQVSNKKGSWYIPSLEMIDHVPEEHVEIAQKWYHAFLETTPKGEEVNVAALTAVTTNE